MSICRRLTFPECVNFPMQVPSAKRLSRATQVARAMMDSRT